MAQSKKVFQCVKNLFNPNQASTCELYKGCKSPYMKRSGSKDAKILLIGEAPGQQEDEQGLPFIGDSGTLLRHSLDLAGVTDFAVTNSVRCRPPGNRDPKMSEIHTCKGFLEEDIVSMPNLKLLVLLGNHAMLAILGHKGILEASGTYSTTTIDNKEYGVLCIMHPSYVLQNPKELNNFNNHVGRIPNAITGALTDVNDEGIYHTITTYAEWQDLIAKIRKAGKFVYDIETNSLDPYPTTSQITCMSFSVAAREAYVIEMSNVGVFPFLLADLYQIMTDKSIGKIGQNIKFDNLWINVRWDIPVKGTIWDTSIAQFLLDENESHGLKSMAWKYTKLGGYDQTLVRGEPHMATGANLLKYSCMDADITYRIYEIQKPKIEADKGLKFLNETLMLPVTDVLLEMEKKGIRIDLDRLKECKKNVDLKLDELDKEIYIVPSVIQFQTDSGLVFNPRSSLQLREVLFKYEGLASTKKTEKTKAPSTDRSVLESYREVSKIFIFLNEIKDDQRVGGTSNRW
jgi:uracil-DNA glycosylase family 4